MVLGLGPRYYACVLNYIIYCSCPGCDVTMRYCALDPNYGDDGIGVRMIDGFWPWWSLDLLVRGGRRVIWAFVDVVLFSPWWTLCSLVLAGRCVIWSLVDVVLTGPW